MNDHTVESLQKPFFSQLECHNGFHEIQYYVTGFPKVATQKQ